MNEIPQVDIEKARRIIQFIKNCRIGDRVKAKGEYVIVQNMTGDTVQVKFEDGHMEWLKLEQVEQYIVDTRLKSCPFCGCQKTAPVSQERAYGGEQPFSCSKCGNRFSADKTIDNTRHTTKYCQNCGKKSAKFVGGTYKCESCSNIQR